MARGLLIVSHRSTTNFLLPTISRVSPSKWRTPFFPNLLPSSRPSLSLRLNCSCSHPQQPQHPIHLSNYGDMFARRMAMAGLQPHHRIAIGVSGGSDSMALCVLAAAWKADAFNASASGDNGGPIEGLLAITVDHGLRSESRDETELVRRRVTDMGISCEVVRCVWSDGRPNRGHLQEAARDMRYQIFQNVCIKHQIGVLLTAHHADDQAELFIIRLSRNSGVLGLAGMAFTSQLFSTCTHSCGETLNIDGILILRPLLEFLKEDMYKICQHANQEWVEDPSNQSQLFARNRIRMSLKNMPSSFKNELWDLISACRTTRSYVDKVCSSLIDEAVTFMAEGYVIIDLERLRPSHLKDICLSKFVTIILQFVSQRQRPVRGSALRLLLDYFRTIPCKTALTAAGCYLCAAPGYKGTKVLVCCSVNSPPPSKMKLLSKHPSGEEKDHSSEVAQIVAYGKLYIDSLVTNTSGVHFLGLTSCNSVLAEARKLNIISDATLKEILLLQSKEMTKFESQRDIPSNPPEVKHEVRADTSSGSGQLLRGEIGYFMDRFMVVWNLSRKNFVGDADAFNGTRCIWDMGEEFQHDRCWSCVVDLDMAARVRPMVDSDWLYLSKLSSCQNLEQVQQQGTFLASMGQDSEKAVCCFEYVRLSAQRALESIKSIPVAARRSLPVLVNPEGLLLSIPSICFMRCPCLKVSAVFRPRVPLGGGHCSFT